MSQDRFASRLATGLEERANQIYRHSEVRQLFRDLERSLDELLPDGRHKSLVITKLEEAAMWANKAVASPYDVVPEQVEGGQSVGVERLDPRAQGTVGTQGLDALTAGLKNEEGEVWVESNPSLGTVSDRPGGFPRRSDELLG